MEKKGIFGCLKIYQLSGTSTKVLNLRYSRSFLSTAVALISRNPGKVRNRMLRKEHLFRLTSMLNLSPHSNKATNT
jgi:hypothetical protein